MGGFVNPFMPPSPAWPRDIVFAGSSWAGGGGGADSSSADDIEFLHLQDGTPASPALMHGGGAKGSVFPGDGFVMDDGLAAMSGGATLGSILAAPCPISLTDSAPAICSSNESSGGSEQSDLPPQFLLGDQQAAPAWHSAAAYTAVSSMAGEETTRGFGFGGIHSNDLLREAAAACTTPNGKKYQQQLGAVASAAQLQLHGDLEFNTGDLLSFAPEQVTPITDGLQINQKGFGGLHHLDLSSLVSGPALASFNATGLAHNPKQFSEASSGNNNGVAAPFANRSEVPNGNGNGVIAGSGAPKPRVRARRGQATDPHSIAERLRRERISDRMKNLQELVPNSNKTDKASMLDEIIDYVRFLQLQVKVLSMSRLGAAEAVVPLLTESQAESNGLLMSTKPERQGSGSEAQEQDSSELEQEVVQLMENNMTTAMQYLQSKGLCLMPVALASAISTQKGTASAAVRPAGGGGGGDKDDVKRVLDALKPILGSPKETKSRA